MMESSGEKERAAGLSLPPADALPHEEAGLPSVLEVDSRSWEDDSALGDDTYTYELEDNPRQKFDSDWSGFRVTTSVTSSAKSFRHEGGRRYHAFDEDQYFLPNDEIEAGRLDLQHYIWKLTFDGALSWVPIDNNMKNALDIGTGTGIWAMEVAEAYPNLQVLGTDLSPIQPDFVPPNCSFLVDNAEFDWAFDVKFDFIHSRMLTMGLHDWEKYFRQCWENLEPGGWIQTGETQFPQKRAQGEEGDCAFMTWSNGVYEAALKAGINAQASENFSSYLAAQGFINIERVDVQWPVRPWAKGKKNKVIGRVMYENMCKAIPAIGDLLLQRHLGWSKEYVDGLTKQSAEDLKKGHFYCPMVCHRAQKPFDAA